MKSGELVIRLNRRYGRRLKRPVTAHALEDWVAEGLMPGPVARGKGRGRGTEQDWTEASFRAARRVCMIRALGTERNSALRVELYLRNKLDWSETLRGNFIGEFLRLRSRLLWQVDRVRRNAEMRHFLKAWMEVFRFGNGGKLSPDDLTIFFRLFEWIIQAAQRAEFRKFVVAALSEFLGDRREGAEFAEDTSAETLLEQASPDFWRTARAAINLLPWVYTRGFGVINFATTGSAARPFYLGRVAQMLTRPIFRLGVSCAVVAALARAEPAVGKKVSRYVRLLQIVRVKDVEARRHTRAPLNLWDEGIRAELRSAFKELSQ